MLITALWSVDDFSSFVQLIKVENTSSNGVESTNTRYSLNYHSFLKLAVLRVLLKTKKSKWKMPIS